MGGLSNHFNSSYLLEESDIVCKVQSLSSDNYFFRIIDYGILKRVAVVKTISTIKGTCPEKFIIKRHREDSRDDSLGKDEVALVFLKKHADGFRYYDAPNGKFVLNSSQAKYRFGNKPSDKLLDELINYAQTQNGTGRLAAIEELSNSNDTRAIEYLRFVLSDGNLVEKKWAIWALISLKNPPSVEELMKFFDDVNESPYSKEGDITFGDAIYRSRDLINETIVNLGDIFYGSIGANRYVDLSLTQIQWDFKNRIVGFDYASFCRQAMSRNYIKNNVSRKRNIAVLISKLTERGTLDLFAEFLKDDDVQVNYFAVAGLARIFNESIPLFPDFQKNQRAILNQWIQRIIKE
ncbi:MAG: HEAT repeat domain-containing protein [Candidatus Omnitrophica bacterium]|nr:HEAT repeat domain-containing protein [Candidatus Omnitrophota bacterium]